MDSLRVSLVWLVQTLQRRWFVLFTLYSLLFYHVYLDKDIGCICQTHPAQTRDCWVYLLVPGLVLFLVQLWVDLGFHRGLKVLCGNAGGRVLLVLLRRVLEAGFVGLLWIESVLLDGDWYVCYICCGQEDKRCRPSSGLSYSDYGERYRYNSGFLRPDSAIRNESQVIGLLLVCVVVLVAAILSWVGPCCSSCDWPEAVLEEAELVVSQRIRAAARDQIRTKLDQGQGFGGLERDLLLDQSQVQAPVLMSPLYREDQV